MKQKESSSTLSILAALIFIVLLIGLGFYVGRPKKSATTDNFPPGKVVFTEYFDFECPACQLFAKEVLPKLEEKYTGKIDFVYKQFPLPQHKQARAAAAAAICAEKQGKFKEYRNQLVANYEKWTEDPSQLDQYAKDISLDEAQYNSCKISSQTTKRIDEDFKEGVDRGVQATPTVYINNEKIEGVNEVSFYEKKIDALLKK